MLCALKHIPVVVQTGLFAGQYCKKTLGVSCYA